LVKTLVASFPSRNTAAEGTRVDVIPLAMISLPLVVRTRWVRLTASSGVWWPSTVADRMPWLVLSTKFNAVTVLPAWVNFNPPLWWTVPRMLTWVSVPPVTGKLTPPEEGAVAGAAGPTWTAAVFNACTVAEASLRFVSLPVNVSVTFCADADPLGLADELAVIVGDFDAGVVAGLEDFDELLPHPDAATATATRPNARERGT